MKKRHLQAQLLRLAKQFPVITLTGPRQSGKTTLCRTTFPKKKYVSLEDRDRRQFAFDDPRGFLKEYDGAIIDEIQKAPDLVSYIQSIVDEKKKSGQFILTGSQNLAISQTVSQSLSGRTAVLTLLPFSIGEIQDDVNSLSVNELMLKGFYPRIYDKKLNPTEALNAYLETYVDRDVKQLKSIHDLNLFHRFLKLCAGRTGQITNFSAIANETGISHTTAQQWLSVLEASYIVTLLPPYFKNFNKRIVKSPKLYFYDVGLAAFLLGIHDANQMSRDPLRGALFENMIVIDFLKNRLHHSKPNDLYFFRDAKENEVDLLLSKSGKLVPIEIKASATFSSSFLSGIHSFQKTSKDPLAKPAVIYGGNDSEQRTGVDVISYKDCFKYYKRVFKG